MKKQRGYEAFESYYADIYKDRWPQLKSSLLGEDKKIAFKNLEATETKHAVFSGRELAQNCFEIPERGDIPQDGSGIPLWYEMDLASVFAAVSLGVVSGHEVLDMCAAPGGKSLVMWTQMKGLGRLVSNEMSENRRHRLKSVLRSYIPRERRDQLFLWGKDGQKIGIKFPMEFDRILVDAPCSGERHLLETKSELEQWTSSRTKKLSARQYSMLCSALLSVKPGGQITYSTCSISPLENDGVIGKLLKKKSDDIEVVSDQQALPEFVEKTQFGYQILPDRSGGFGPIYWSVLKRK